MLASGSGNGSRMSWRATLTRSAKPAARALAEMVSTAPGAMSSAVTCRPWRAR